MGFSDCHLLCFQNEVIKQCGCYIPGLYHFSDINRTCNTHELISCCEIAYSRVFSNNTKYINPLTCPIECDSKIYSISTSNANLEIPAFIKKKFIEEKIISEELLANDERRLKDNIASFNIYMPDLVYTEITQEPLFTFIDLLASIGGSTGLFLGGSLLSLLEVFEAIVTLCKKLRTNKDKTVNEM